MNRWPKIRRMRKHASAFPKRACGRSAPGSRRPSVLEPMTRSAPAAIASRRAGISSGWSEKSPSRKTTTSGRRGRERGDAREAGASVAAPVLPHEPDRQAARDERRPVGRAVVDDDDLGDAIPRDRAHDERKRLAFVEDRDDDSALSRQRAGEPPGRSERDGEAREDERGGDSRPPARALSEDEDREGRGDDGLKEDVRRDARGGDPREGPGVQEVGDRRAEQDDRAEAPPGAARGTSWARTAAARGSTRRRSEWRRSGRPPP